MGYFDKATGMHGLHSRMNCWPTAPSFSRSVRSNYYSLESFH
ncbi:uncharacterized protein METZ01_LOCUS322160 [marine metagenome]|uniref:Uncharacterized protein n=1 Tax=marine metagenome TaxID=408172 RepID=A0A382P7S2_9ZZZZ